MRSRWSRPKFILSRCCRLTDRFVSVSLVSNLDLNSREAAASSPPCQRTSLASSLPFSLSLSLSRSLSLSQRRERFQANINGRIIYYTRTRGIDSQESESRRLLKFPALPAEVLRAARLVTRQRDESI